MKIKNKNFTATIPIELIAAIKAQAAASELSVSAYLRRLIKKDLQSLK